MLKHRRTQSAFTLIELLIVITIIAILAALLFPVFARAREKARQASCFSNLKQLSLGMLMYAQDYDETWPLAYYYQDGWNQEYAWDFHVDWVNGTSELGLIAPYTKSGEISSCPSAKGLQSWGRPYTGYAYNTSYIGHGQLEPVVDSASLGDVQSPSETVLLCDSAFYTTWPSAGLGGNNFLRSPSDASYPWIGPNVHYRHNSTVNVAYCDGHVKAATRKFNTSSSDASLADLSADDSAYDLQ